MRRTSSRGSGAGSSSTSSKVPETSSRSEEHTSELQSQSNLVCRLLLEKKNTQLRFLYNENQKKQVVIQLVLDVSNFYPIHSYVSHMYVGLKPDNRIVLFGVRNEPL